MIFKSAGYTVEFLLPDGKMIYRQLGGLDGVSFSAGEIVTISGGKRTDMYKIVNVVHQFDKRLGVDGSDSLSLSVTHVILEFKLGATELS